MLIALRSVESPPRVPRRDSNSGLPYSKPKHTIELRCTLTELHCTLPSDIIQAMGRQEELKRWTDYDGGLIKIYFMVSVLYILYEPNVVAQKIQ